MSTEIRFLLAIVLMVAVLVVTNLLFPTVPPEELAEPVVGDSVPGAVTDTGVPSAMAGGETQPGPDNPEAALPLPQAAVAPDSEEVDEAALGERLTRAEGSGVSETDSAGRTLVVDGPLYTFTFDTRGARLVSARLDQFPSLRFEGAVELVRPETRGELGTRILVGTDTLDLRDLPFQVEPADGLELVAGGPPQTLTFTYQHPSHPFNFQVSYTFNPDVYVADAAARVGGVDADLALTDLGTGIPFNEQRDRDEIRAAAYVVNPLQEGIRAERLDRIQGTRVEGGPFLWAAFKSKYFLVALLAGGNEEEERYLGGAIATEFPAVEHAADLAVSQPVSADGSYDFRLFMGPQEFARLSNLGEDMQNVNPYGWKFIRPVVRPIVGIIMAVLTFLHENLRIGYGWVLILFGVLMRVALFPLNQKAMRSQMKNMAVQPLLQEIQTKYKDNPEKLQKEMMKLYKEHGFNPLGGCLPMLIPFPVLIALFFVFQNTIELRGVPFLWLPDLSAPDPLYILPAFLGISMFLLQFVSMRSMPQQNQQMKMMMYVMPVMMVFIFFQLASGLNLYYATANIATLPQQIYIAKERQKAQAKGPLTLSQDDDLAPAKGPLPPGVKKKKK